MARSWNETGILQKNIKIMRSISATNFGHVSFLFAVQSVGWELVRCAYQNEEEFRLELSVVRQ